MAKYTVEVRDILEEKAGYTHEAGFSEIDDVIEKSWDKVFTTKCYFFDEDYRKPLCCKILKHFYMREIGAETVGLWQYWMNRTLEEQMPYYNQMYKSTLLRYPIFANTDTTTHHKRENTGETTEDETGNENQTAARELTSNRDTVNNGTSYVTDDLTEDTTQNVIGSKDSNTETEETDDFTKNTETNETGRNEDNKSVTVNGTDTKNTVTSDTDVSSGTKDTTNTHWDLYSDTPQSGLQNIVANDGADADLQYLTNFRKTTDETKETVNTTDNKNGTVDETGTSFEETGENDILETSKNTVTDEISNDLKNSYSETHEDYTEDSTGNKTSHEVTNGATWNEETSGYIENETSGYDKNNVYNSLGTSHDLETFGEHFTGKIGSDTYAEMLMKFRDTFLNLDMELINHFEENFIQLW